MGAMPYMRQNASGGGHPQETYCRRYTGHVHDAGTAFGQAVTRDYARRYEIKVTEVRLSSYRSGQSACAGRHV